jgi:hypothetical protein
MMFRLAFACRPKDDMAMKGDIENPVRHGRCGLLSPLIPNRPHIPMTSLYLVPRPSGPESSEFPPGMIHRASDRCPFKDNNVDESEHATCCAFRVDEASLYLRALNSQELSPRILEHKNSDEVLAFADALAEALAVHTKFVGYAAQYLSGSDNPSLEDFVLCEPKSGWRVSVVKALKRLEQAVEWHRKGGLAGCSVAVEPTSQS